MLPKGLEFRRHASYVMRDASSRNESCSLLAALPNLSLVQCERLWMDSPIIVQIIGETLADEAERQTVETYIAERASRGLRSLGVAQSSDGGNSWRLVGLISLLDPPRPDSAATIKRAQELGVEVSSLFTRPI